MRTDIEKSVTIALLLDDYGELLTPHQREIIGMYYGEDFSLAEIAELTGITRQGVRDVIKKAETTLLTYEEKIGMQAKLQSLREQLQKIADTLRCDIADDAQKCRNAAESIEKLLS